MRGRTFVMALALLGLATPVSAAVLATYPMTTGTDATIFAPAFTPTEDTDSNSLASNFSGSSGYAGINGAGNNFTGTSAQGGGSIYVRVAGTGADLPASMSANQYFTFTITPNAGYALNMSSLTFDWAFSHTATTGTPFNGNFAVRSSIDNFLTSLATISAASSSSINFANHSISSLGSNSAYQGVTVPVEFRFYAFDNSQATSDAAAVSRLDTVILNGTVTAIPEPSLLLLGSLGCAGIVVARRRVRPA